MQTEAKKNEGRAKREACFEGAERSEPGGCASSRVSTKPPLQKLELTWIGKEEKIAVEPRILIEDPEKSNAANGKTENMIVHGDNLLALKALEQKYAGKVKCIYIDPPYNTGSAFEHYDDNLEHSQWLNLMRPRLEIMNQLLSDDGFFCVQIDDSEGAYLKVLCDEIFGRSNYQTTIYVRVRYPDKTLKADMAYHKEIEQVHIYRKSVKAKPILDVENVGYDKFCFRIDIKGTPIKELKLGGKTVEVYEKGSYKVVKVEGSVDGLKEVWASGTILDGNSSGRFFRDYLTGRYEEDGYGVLYKVDGIGDDSLGYRYFTGPNKAGATKGKYYQGVPKSKIGGEMLKRVPIHGFYDFAANFGNCRNEGGADFRGGKKPEVLIESLLRHFSNPGDLVLDSFLGSGTTCAVAQKMGRNWIGIEMGDHAYTHCKVRLDKVIAGEDLGGVTKATGWTKGGGYRFYELAPSMVKFDVFGEAVINAQYNADMLAAGMALQEGFIYEPDVKVYWKQAHAKGNENSWLYTTTRHIGREYLASIAGELKSGEFLEIACTSFDAKAAKDYPKITMRKIPESILKRCEFDRDSYALNIVNAPEAEEDGE